jgi:catechol 2,3-dioxygenase-like lactoylglutathione lyase family enzyme
MSMMERFRVTQVDHVELFVPDRNEAAAWYGRILGLEIVRELEHWAADVSGPLMLSTEHGGTKLALFTGAPQCDRATAGFHRVAFRVSRQAFDAFLIHIRENPVFNDKGEETRELAVNDYGAAWSVYFHDPYGHRLEVTTYEVGTGRKLDNNH